MLRSELLNRLRDEVAGGEWDELASGGLVVGAFNRGVLLEMKDAVPSEDGEIDGRQVDGLGAALEAYLEKHMADQPEGWKWIRLASLYLTFVARRPMHPIDRMKIKATALPDGRARYECPEKSVDPRSACRWCVCRRMSNYDVMKRRMQGEFLGFDQAAMIEKFGLRSDADWLYLRFVGQEYRVSRTDGGVQWSADGFATVHEADYNETMTIYDVLCYSKPNCRAAGRFVNMSAISAVQGGSVSQSGGMLDGAVRWMGEHQDRIAGAFERLGGMPDDRGDVAARLPMFDFLPALLRFWAADDEFPASLDIFVDENMLDFMHYETVWFAVIHLLGRVREEMEA